MIRLLLLINIFRVEEQILSLLSEAKRTAYNPQQLRNGAIGILDLGELSTVTTNWGAVVPTPMDFAPTLHWPRNAPFQHQYSYGNLLFVARKGNVATIHNWLAIFNTDFSPIRNFSGNVLNPDGWPILATSDDPRTWPQGVWPGPYRIDPLTGNEVWGEFTSDRDVFAEYTDESNPRGPIGIKVRQLGYSYGRSYAEDILIFRFFLFNTTQDTLDSLWIGIRSYNLVDFDLLDLIHARRINPTTNTVDFIYWTDFDNIPQSPWISTGPIGIAILRTPFNMGVTDFHWYVRTYDPLTDSTMYPVVISDTSSPYIDPSFYFHGSQENPRIDLTPPPNPERYMCIIGVGPFTLTPRDSVEFSIAFVCGQDTLELIRNAETAFRMERFEFQGPSAPPPPRLTLSPGDGYVILSWTHHPSEITPDPFTGDYDFEGFRIYKSTDFGRTWGEPITDANGRLVGYVPLAIFDRIDGIFGPDPLNPYFDRGNDAGIRYYFIDSMVINGLTYYYSVTAFDRGDTLNNLPSMESPIGNINAPNCDSITPSPRPPNLSPGYLLGDSVLTPRFGITTAEVKVRVLDPYFVREDSYKVYFSQIRDTLCLSVRSLIGDTLKLSYIPLTRKPLPPFDGLELDITNYPDGPSSPQWIHYSGTPSTFEWFVDDRGRGPTYWRNMGEFIIQANYQDSTEVLGVRPFSFSQDYPYLPTTRWFKLPFKVKFIGVGGTDTSHPDRVYLMDFNLLAPIPGISPLGWDWTPGGLAWTPNPNYRYLLSDQLGFLKYIRDENQNIVDSIVVFVRTENGPQNAIPPQEGDIIRIKIHKSIDTTVYYVFHTKSPKVTSIPSFQVRVVPNPFIVTSGLETNLGEGVIMFYGVPQHSKIHIYSVSGEHIKTLENSSDLGIVKWNLKNKFELDVAYGLYFFVVETRDGQVYKGKFAIIR